MLQLAVDVALSNWADIKEVSDIYAAVKNRVWKMCQDHPVLSKQYWKAQNLEFNPGEDFFDPADSDNPDPLNRTEQHDLDADDEFRTFRKPIMSHEEGKDFIPRVFSSIQEYCEKYELDIPFTSPNGLFQAMKAFGETQWGNREEVIISEATKWFAVDEEILLKHEFIQSSQLASLFLKQTWADLREQRGLVENDGLEGINGQFFNGLFEMDDFGVAKTEETEDEQMGFYGDMEPMDIDNAMNEPVDAVLNLFL
jgi:hypothetical protein